MALSEFQGTQILYQGEGVVGNRLHPEETAEVSFARCFCGYYHVSDLRR